MAAPRTVAVVALTTLVVMALGDFLVRMNGLLWQVLPDLGSVPFYVMWLPVGALWIAVDRDLGRGPWMGRRPRNRVDTLVIAGAIAATIALYLPAVTRALRGELHAPASVFAIAGGGVLGPIVEEWLFRGLLWNHLRKIAPGRRGLWLAIGAGSLMFGIWHMTFEGYTLQTLGNALIHASFGVVVAFTRWRTDGIALGCVLHVAGNTLMILAS